MGAAAGTAQQASPRPTSAPSSVYRPRQPQASPLYRLINDHFQEFCTVYREHLAASPTNVPTPAYDVPKWAWSAPRTADRFASPPPMRAAPCLSVSS
jgi:hypothetical protein